MPKSKLKKKFLFLQGPVGSFFSDLAQILEADGHQVFKINLCLGDSLFWRRKGSINYRSTPGNWPKFIRYIYLQKNITNIVLLGEQRWYHKKAISIANELGIHVTVTDFGYIRPDWITLEKNAMNGGSELTRDADEILSIAEKFTDPNADYKLRYRSKFWSMALPDIAYNILSQICWFLYPHYRSHQKYNVAATYIGTFSRILTAKFREKATNHLIDNMQKQSEPVFLLPLQMETDFQLRAYSHFSSMREVLIDVIKSFADFAPGKASLVVKVHPYDPNIQNFKRHCSSIARMYDVEHRVHFIDGGNAHRLIKACSGIVTVNSTMGLESLMLNCPVFVMSQCNYRIKGLVETDNLDQFWQNPKPVNERLRDAFVQTLIASSLIRGVFYNKPGLDNAVQEAKWRLVEDKVGVPVLRKEIESGISSQNIGPQSI